MKPCETMSDANSLRPATAGPEELQVIAADGVTLAATLFRPAVDNGGAILIVPATGVTQAYYFRYAEFLSRHGFTVMLFDYRGVGKSLSGDIRDFQAQMHDWGEQDLAAMLDWIKANLPPQKLFVVTNSVGGQIFGLAENCNLIDGAVMIAAAHGYCGNWKWPASFMVKTFWKRVAPRLIRRQGYFPGNSMGLGEDLPAGIAREWGSWCLEPDFLFGKYPDFVTRRYEQLQIPILSYSFDDDRLANAFRVDKLMDKFSGAEIERRHVFVADTVLEKIGHIGFFRKELQETLWTDTLGWLSENM